MYRFSLHKFFLTWLYQGPAARTFLISTGLAGLGFILKIPWKYEQDITSYFINILFFPMGITGLSLLLKAFFSKRATLYVLLPLVTITLFPMRVVCKILTGSLPPSLFSGLVFMAVVSGSLIGAYKINRDLSIPIKKDPANP